jgi:hypothetical protein
MLEKVGALAFGETVHEVEKLESGKVAKLRVTLGGVEGLKDSSFRN